jgi:hypothetical protein
MSRMGIRGPLGFLVFFESAEPETSTLAKTAPSPPGPLITPTENKPKGDRATTAPKTSTATKAPAAAKAAAQVVSEPTGEYSISAAVKHMKANAHSTSQGACAKYVRLGIEAGGIAIPWPRPVHAKDYGPTLVQHGFTIVPSEGYVAVAGDVIVLQPPKAGGSGHLQMFDGKIWLSDFRQKAEVYPGSSYRNAKVAYVIYRPPTSKPASQTE